MAIQYINASVITRSKGHNALSAAAYRANEKLHCERTSRTFDYTNKGDCVHAEILLPKSAYLDGSKKDGHPFHSREKMWNSIEQIEDAHNRRASAQLAFELKVALPKELSKEQNAELIRSYIKDYYVDKHGVVADICIHDKADGNPHAHVMITFRELVGTEFSKQKVRSMTTDLRTYNGVHYAVEDKLNVQWETFQNKYFDQRNIDIKVDEGYIIPTVHEGHSRDSDFYYDRDEQNNNIKQQNVDIVLTDPEIIIQTLETKYAVFDKRDIEKMAFKQTAYSTDPTHYHDVLNTVLSSDKLIQLGYSEAGRLSYTTEINYRKELQMIDTAHVMHGDDLANIDNQAIQKVSEQDGLSTEQQEAIRHIAQSGQIACVVGSAGAGKTRAMKSLNDLYRDQNIQVFGAAISGKAAQGLEEEAGIESKTIASLLHGYRNKSGHKYLPEKGSVLVVDEAGMIGLKDMHSLVEMSQDRRYKLVLVGDPEQLQPVEHGAPFRAILNKIGHASILQIRRQSDAKERAITQQMAQGNIGIAIDHYLEDDRILLDDPSNLKTALFSQWKHYTDDLNQTLIVAHTQKDVEELNHHARAYLKDHGKLLDPNAYDIKVSGKSYVKEFAVNERIIFLKNDRTLGVKNGLLGHIIGLDGDQVTVKLDNDKIVKFNAKTYQNFDYGYAVTVHKSQGVTVDNCLAYASGKGWDRFISYVALSRHRHNVHLYADKESYHDIQGLKRQLSSEPLRDNVLDYPLQFVMRRGYDATKFANNAVDKVKGTYHKTKDAWNFLFNYAQYKSDKSHSLQQQSLREKQALNIEAIQIADLADLHSEVLKQYREFKNQYGAKWYENSEAKTAYRTIEDGFYSRNKAAYDIYLNHEKFDRALALNNITSSNLEEWASAYTAESRVRAFEGAEGFAVKGKLAQSISENSESNRYVSSRNLWKEVNIAQASYVARVKSVQIEGFTDRLNTLNHYLNENQAATRYWKKSKADDFNHTANAGGNIGAKSEDPQTAENRQDKILLPEHQQQYEKISKAYNVKSEILAAKIMGDLEQYQPVLAVKFPYQATYEKVIATLKRKADNFAKRETIQTYISPESTQLQREQAAYKLNQDFKAHVGMGYEEGLLWGNVARTAAPEKTRQARASLDPQYLPLFDAVAAYQEKIHTAAQAYSTLKAAERSLKQQLNVALEGRLSSGQLTPEIQALQKASYALMATRNEAAVQLNNQHPELMQWYENDAKKLDQILPQFKADRFKRHVQWHDYAKMVKATQHQRFEDYAHTQKTFWDYDLITQRLMENPAETYTQILGQPKSKNSREMRWSGGLIVSLTGKNQGQWYDFAQGMGGSPVQAMMAFNGTTYLDALKEGASMANLTESQAMVKNSESATPIRTIAPKEDKEKAYKIKSAQSIWAATQPIAFTTAEAYMSKHRNIYDVNNTQLRFLPVGAKWIDFVEKDGEFIPEEKINKVPAMVIASKDKEGNVLGVQRTYLDKETLNKNKRFDNPKLSKGSIKNGAVLQEGSNGRVYIAEGVETGASMGLADPKCTVLISMSVSNMRNMVDKIQSYEPKEVILLKDNDGVNAKSDIGFNKAVKAYKKANFNLKILEPEMLTRIAKVKGNKAKTDWNDVIQDKGVNGLRKDCGLPIPEYEKKYLRSLDELKKVRLTRDQAAKPEYKAVALHVSLKKDTLLSLHDFYNGRLEKIPEVAKIVQDKNAEVRASAFNIMRHPDMIAAAKDMNQYDRILVDAERYAERAAKQAQQAKTNRKGKGFRA